MRIRPAPDQIDEILALDLPWSKEEPDERTEWWALDGDPSKAYAGAFVEGEALHLERCYVSPELRGGRLQRRLIRVREAWGRRMGCTHAVTYTSTAFWKSYRSLIRCGYLPTGYRFVGGRGWIDWRREL
jgi:GNAT superfamily N-acetyltransferase